ncbi:MFS transporter [Novosphingobium sp. 9]|uniref:MFS transporter n=1 Tax=Novosphingobium sp. 9 TaxID=2025349 RepID=UPI0021B53FE5|nr:MFS transporter [Novosphingobium sp. 9]
MADVAYSPAAQQSSIPCKSSSTGSGRPTSAWGILILLSVGVLIAYIDRTSIASVLADRPFISYFALTDVQRGWVNAAFFWSYAVVQVPMGWIVDRYGVKLPYTLCFGIWCLATAVTGAVATLYALLLLRLIVGVAESAVIPASYRWIRDNFDERRAGSAVGIFAAGNKLGPALGAPVAAWLIVHYDWRMMFFATGLLGLAWLVPWIGLVRNDLPSAAERQERHRRASAVSLRAIIASPVVWGTMISSFCYGYFTFYCMSWMPSYLVEERGLSLQASGLYTFFSFAGIAVVAVLAGWMADRIIARGGDAVFVRKAFVVAGFIGGCTVIFGAYATSLHVALFWNVFSLSWLGLATANNLALCRLTLIPRQAVGLTTGVQQVALSLSGGVSASVSGWLLHISGGYDMPILVIVLFCLIGAGATVVLMRREWAPQISGTTDKEASAQEC